jgi:hypothetical protein
MKTSSCPRIPFRKAHNSPATTKTERKIKWAININTQNYWVFGIYYNIKLKFPSREKQSTVRQRNITLHVHLWFEQTRAYRTPPFPHNAYLFSIIKVTDKKGKVVPVLN